MADNGNEKSGFVSWPGLWAVLGVIVAPIGLIAGYAVDRANTAIEDALDAKVTAVNGHIGMVNEHQLDSVEGKLIKRADDLEMRCVKNADRLERKILELEKRCIELQHHTYGSYMPNRDKDL